jgi:cytochrome c biogenesis protein CcdA
MTALSDFFHMIAINSTFPIVSAICFGLLAALGPCTMASNVAALAYISRDATKKGAALFSSLLYMLGSVIALSLLGGIIILLGLDTPAIQNFLQTVGTYILGPVFIIAGILLLIIDKLSLGSGGTTYKVIDKVKDKGYIGSLIMGLFMGITFCPYSAILFFMALLPMAFATSGGVVLPVFYAVGTALPVVVFGALIALGFQFVGRWINNITKFNKYIKIAMSIVFIIVGIYIIIQNF